MDKEEGEVLKFKINTITSDMLYLKNMWDQIKLKQIEMMDCKIKVQNYEIY